MKGTRKGWFPTLQADIFMPFSEWTKCDFLEWTKCDFLNGQLVYLSICKRVNSSATSHSSSYHSLPNLRMSGSFKNL